MSELEFVKPLPNRPSSLVSTGALLAFAGLTAGAAAAGAGSDGRSLWYRRLRKPPFQPSPRVFGPVWGVLYSLIALSAHRVWRKRERPGRGSALALWGAQLGLNALWSVLFFRRRNPKAALVDIGLMLPAISLYTAAASKVDKPAAWLMAPYLAWTGFASVLNEEIVRRNA